jgi:oxygen-independent coproporphyrinogen-3 oxidase
MCRNALDYGAIEVRFGIRFEERFARELASLRPLADDGLIVTGERGFTVTPRGRLLLRVVAMAFDASAQHAGEAPAWAGRKPARPHFSRVI